jgi:hypothetical protein
MKSVAIMQPYFFPYIGYFQLLSAVNTFVFYDDVDFIKGGWINRNRVLANGQPYLFTLPLKNASSFKKINETEIDSDKFDLWRTKTLRLFEQSYARAPYVAQGLELVNTIFIKEYSDVAQIAKESILTIVNFLGLSTDITLTSSIYENSNLSAQTRVLDICCKEGASVYINAAGGKSLYDKEAFKNVNIDLHFIKPVLEPYPQGKTLTFVPGLSIIDVIMNNSKEDIIKLVSKCELE